MADSDRSNGYDEIAAGFIAARSRNGLRIGADVVAAWSQQLPRGSSVLDLGCGNGIPISQTLIEQGLQVYGVDASPALVADFRSRFPRVPVECAGVEDSDFFAKRFDGVVSWGLIFLLDEGTQRRLISKIASALCPGGRLLFTAPHQVCAWNDVLTGRSSRSLGFQEYRRVLQSEGLRLVGSQADEGENHYFLAEKGERPESG